MSPPRGGKKGRKGRGKGLRPRPSRAVSQATERSRATFRTSPREHERRGVRVQAAPRHRGDPTCTACSVGSASSSSRPGGEPGPARTHHRALRAAPSTTSPVLTRRASRHPRPSPDVCARPGRARTASHSIVSLRKSRSRDRCCSLVKTRFSYPSLPTPCTSGTLDRQSACVRSHAPSIMAATPTCRTVCYRSG